ncbi:MAG: ABC transporter ATP-binding protein [Proteobacteria bacterium]|nr:ABC transporter ATP-binding protein [Pseudomonadota bacterium]
MALLEIQDLKAAYGHVPILHKIDMHVEQGEFVGVLGHNGMGKTTLMRAIMGFVTTTGGNIKFQDKEIRRLPTYRRARMGMSLVPQGREIFPNLTVLENLTVGVLGKKGSLDRIDEMLEFFPRLSPLLDRRGGALSGGEQQILAIARCLCNHPSFILLDEPTEGVQPSIIHEISDVLKELQAKQNLTIVLVEQNLDFILGLASRVYTISRGVLDTEIPLENIKDSAMVAEYLGFGT